MAFIRASRLNAQFFNDSENAPGTDSAEDIEAFASPACPAKPANPASPANPATTTDGKRDCEDLRLWLALTLRQGATQGTARRYLGRLHALHTLFLQRKQVAWEAEAEREGLLPGRDMATEEASKEGSQNAERFFAGLRGFIDSHYPTPDLSRQLAELRRLASRKDLLGKSEVARALLWLFYSASTSLEPALDLRLGVSLPDIAQLKELASMVSTARRSYMFAATDRSHRRPQQLRALAQAFRELLKHDNVLQPIPDPDLIPALWVEAALEAGLHPLRIRSALNRIPAPCSWLRLLGPGPAGECDDATPEVQEGSDRLDILRRVADWLSPMSESWFAMRLRRGVGAEAVLALAAEEFPLQSAEIDIFQPLREGAERQWDSPKQEPARPQALIPGILFIRMRSDLAPQFFGKARGLAHPFKSTSGSQCPYAIIPDTQMEAFRKAAKMAGAAGSLAFEKNPDLVPDRRVEIIGGHFKGYRGTIYRRVGTAPEGDMRIFSLRLSETDYITWQVSVEEKFLQPL